MKAGQVFTIEPMINAGEGEEWWPRAYAELNIPVMLRPMGPRRPGSLGCQGLYVLLSCPVLVLMAGGWRDRMWPDGWTAVTADGSRSAQFEHTLLVSGLPVNSLMLDHQLCSLTWRCDFGCVNLTV